jgi:manganese/iron transport system ATP-binding protein
MNHHVLENAPEEAGAASAGLAVDAITVSYRNGQTALTNAGFSIPRGTIMGFVPLAAGSVSIMGQPAKRALSRNLVAYVPQAEEVDWNFPILVEDVVMMGRYGHMNFLRISTENDRRKVDEALERVGMTAYRKRQIGELSGGQKKRVFLARALAQEGQVILLDEPFTGVDVTTEEAIIALLRDLRSEGRVMLVSTHNLGSVPEFCDRAILLNRTVLASGPTEQVFTRENLEKTFGGVLRHFVLGGADLHDDEDTRSVTVLTDDERPFVLYGDKAQSTTGPTAPLDPEKARSS